MENEVFFAFIVLPLLTRPAAPRLATQAINLPIETNRPHAFLTFAIITDFARNLFPFTSRRDLFQ